SLLIGLAGALPGAMSPQPNSWALWAAVLFFLSTGAFALNDYFDVDNDKISKPHRAIPSGAITKSNALTVFFVSSAIGLTTAVFGLPFSLIGLTLSYFSFGIIYNYLVRRTAVLKTTMAALISVIPIAGGGLVAYKDNAIIVLVASASFLYIMSRELRMDVLDIEGDSKGGVKTLAISLGQTRVQSMSIFMMVTSIVGISVCSFFFLPEPIGAIMIAVVVISQITCELMWASSHPRLRRQSVRLQWGAMLGGVLVLSLA
ncbi:MAG: UbiA family prenyltransferase, partial [Micrococcales bacterium]|nr:UbiA family prenyltransferase [Micrococcales bacterium]